MARNRFIWLFFGILALIILLSALMIQYSSSPSLKPRITVTEAGAGSFYTIRTQEGTVVLRTGFPVNVGDVFINEDDQAFQITRVSGWNAQAKSTRLDNQPQPQNQRQAGLSLRPDQAIPVQSGGVRVAIYHTHSDESYPITDGTDSILGNGTIFEVGKSMAESLADSGISVIHSDNTHGLHDQNAYYRSRRTAFQLLKKRPDAVFDVHRDSAPSEEYLTLINGIDTSKTMIVIGRQNPNMSTNMAFARRIKAHADKIYPGLIRGIFIGRGNYNQDLYPSSLLFEIGTSELSRESAERGARNLGDVVSTVLRQRG